MSQGYLYVGAAPMASKVEFESNTLSAWPYRARRRMKYTSCTMLVQDLLVAKRDLRLLRNVVEMFHDCCASIDPMLHDQSAFRMPFGAHAARATRARFRQTTHRLRKWTGRHRTAGQSEVNRQCTASRRTALLRLHVSGSDVTSQLDRAGADQCKPRSDLPGRCQGAVFLSEPNYSWIFEWSRPNGNASCRRLDSPSGT